MTLTSQLREATQIQHQQIEKAQLLRLLMSPDLSKEEYSKILAAWYRFLRPLEQNLQNLKGLDAVLPDLGDRMKLPLLESDLQALGLNPEKLSDCPNYPKPSSAIEALGVLYVLEGSSLGAQLIIKKLQQQDWYEAIYGQFYAGYKKNTGKMWKSFKAILDSFSDSPQTDSVLSNANQTFESLRIWMHEGYLRC